MPACLDAHLTYMRLRGLTENTIYQRTRALYRLREQLGIDLFTATPDQLASWRAGLPGDEAVRSYVSHVHQFYAWAVKAGKVADNPADDLPVPRKPRRLPRPIAEAPLMLALASAPPRIRPWLVLAGWAGLRAKEIAFLRRRSVLDSARPPVLVIASDATKGRNERTVPMSDFVMAELRPVLPSSGFVFRRLDGQPGPNMPALVSRLCNDHLHDCGLPDTLHTLRHRFLTGAYRVTHDLRLVQELAGHSTPAQAAGYAAYDSASAIRAVAEIPVPGLHAVRDLELQKTTQG